MNPDISPHEFIKSSSLHTHQKTSYSQPPPPPPPSFFQSQQQQQQQKGLSGQIYTTVDFLVKYSLLSKMQIVIFLSMFLLLSIGTFRRNLNYCYAYWK